MFSRTSVSREARDGRPLSARGSFVDRLRSMQIGGSGSRTAANPATGSSVSSAANRRVRSPADSANGVSNGIHHSGARPTGLGTAASKPAGGVLPGAVRKVAPKEQLGHSSGLASAAGTVPGAAIRSGRGSPPPQAARLVSTSEPTGGLRATGAASPPPRSPGKFPSREMSPVKTHKQAHAIKAAGAALPFPGLKVGITLMTRKPHRFDWCATAAEAAPRGAAANRTQAARAAAARCYRPAPLAWSAPPPERAASAPSPPSPATLSPLRLLPFPPVPRT